MKKTLVLGCALLASLALMFTSCASGSDDGAKKEKKGKAAKVTEADYLNFLNDGDYVSCINYLNEKNAKNEKKNGSYIRDFYDVAMMNHLSANYEDAINTSNEIDQLMHDALTVSVSKTAGAAALNENIADYAGLPYEYIFINIFNALNYYNKGDIDEAGVEVRKLNDKQREFLTAYGDLLKNYDPDAAIEDEEAAEGEEKKEEGKGGFNKAVAALGLDLAQFNQKPAKSTDDDIFRDSAAARYLSMVFYMMEKDADSAKLDAATIKALGSTYSPADDLSIPAGKGRVDVLAFTGLIGRRGEQRRIFGPFQGISLNIPGLGPVDIPPFDLEYAYPVYPAPQEYNYVAMELMAIPGLKKPIMIEPGRAEVTPAPTNVAKSARVTIGDETVETSLIEDFGDSVRKDVNTKARKAYNRSMARSITKKFSLLMTSSAALYAAQQAGVGPLIVAPYIALAKAVDAIDMTETADIRQVYALPGQASAAGINLDAGTYTVKVEFLDETGSVVDTKEYADVAVTEGVPTLVEAVCTK